MKYDYLIVGSGLFGSTFAYEMNKIGKKCLVIEKSSHIGGNCYTENKDNINIHTYGPHIFHTDSLEIWNWINNFSNFNNYRHSPKVNYNNKIYSFPINLMTLSQIWNVNTPIEAKNKLNNVLITYDDPKNLEEWVLSQVGVEIYEIFIKGYTKKQWGKDPKDLPSSIIKRLPIRLSFDDNYFFDQFQGIPIGGYTKIFEQLLKNIDLKLNTDYFNNIEYFNSVSDKILFTGKIDEFFNYKFGALEYRTLKFEHEKLYLDYFQGCSQVNYTSYKIPYTRITEHKYFENSQSNCTWITREYSTQCKFGDIPFYPINDDKNNVIYNKYKEYSNLFPNVLFGGRLAEYKYYDMHQVIKSSLDLVKKERHRM